MLVIIIPAVCKEKGSPFGDPGICHQYGMAYATLSMAVRIFISSFDVNVEFASVNLVCICSRKEKGKKKKKTVISL